MVDTLERAGFRLVTALARVRVPGPTSSRVLVVCSTSIGDFTVTLPFLAQLMRDGGERGVDVLVISRFGPIAEAIVPARCTVVTLEVAAGPVFVRRVAQARAALRRRRYATVLSVPHSVEEIAGRAKKLALVRAVAGFRARCAGFGTGAALMTRRASERREGAGILHQCLQPFEAAAVAPRVAREEVLAFLDFAPEERRRVDELHSAARASGRSVVGLFAGTRATRETWRPERHLALARALIDAGYAVAFLGGDSDRAAAEVVRRPLGDAFTAQWCGATSIRESIMLYGALDLVVGNDGAPIHLAALGGAPSLSVFCTKEVPGIWEPILAPASRSIRPAWSLRRAPDAYGIEHVTLESVVDAALALLGGAAGHEVWTVGADGAVTRRTIPGFF